MHIPSEKPSTPSAPSELLRMKSLLGCLTRQEGVSGPLGLWRFRVTGTKSFRRSFGTTTEYSEHTERGGLPVDGSAKGCPRDLNARTAKSAKRTQKESLNFETAA